jgi:hypothetical protein
MTDSTPPTSDQSAEIVPRREPPCGVEKQIRRPRGGQPGNHNSLGHGAPPGNNNNVKHGFYSSAFKQVEIKRLEQELQGELNDEEECIRLIVRRYLDSKDADREVQENYLLAIRAVCLAFGRIESFHRTRRAVYDKQTSLDQVWEELKYLPPEVD